MRTGTDSGRIGSQMTGMNASRSSLYRTKSRLMRSAKALHSLPQSWLSKYSAQ